jgi:methylated-DNA-[protein]-cysteine S-methyltransferase
MACFCLFETTIGVCGIAWRNAAVILFQLPERTAAETRLHLVTKFGDGAEVALQLTPPWLQNAVHLCQRHLETGCEDLAQIPVDLSSMPEFNRLVYETALKIRSGKTLTYGEVAKRIGFPHAAQAVGQALGRNPIALIVPCHRVVASSGKLGGFSAPGGGTTKQRLLEIEAAASPFLDGLFARAARDESGSDNNSLI